MPLITSSNTHTLISPVGPSLCVRTNLKTSTAVALRVVKKDRFLGFKVSKKMRIIGMILCRGSLDSDSKLVLEGEILEFMKISRNPNEFPTKKELLDAGRVDLVDAIVKKGGWLSLGWDDSDDEGGCDSKEFDDIRDLDTRFDHSLTSCSSSHQCASSSGRLVHEEIDSNDVKSQLQQMKLKLSSSLRLLRLIKVDQTNKLANDHESSSSELQRLPDTWEFHENEDFNVKDRLKSVRAELAVLEGKLASSIIGAQELVKKKQRRTDGGCRNLQLHNVCIIWHDSASEVLLVGSVDGWTTQRKMKKSEAGAFYLSMKLYPGRYEYKFIVDGVWRVDPLRPIVNTNGYENNVLIIPE